MRMLWKIVGALAILLCSFFATLILMNYVAPLCPQGNRIALKGPFSKQGDFSFFAPALQLIDRSDTVELPTRSPYLLCEENRLLGPAHTAHGEIAPKGAGRYSHAGTGFYFSSSDNSDPNTNGRNYWIVSDKNR
jgi:hypothetical protein